MLRNKIIVLALISMTLISCTGGKQKTLSDREKENYKGNVRYAREIVYSASKEDKEIVKGQVLSEKNFIQFDKQGKILEKGCYEFDQNLDTSYGKTQYRYNKNGLLIEKIIQTNKPNERIKYQIVSLQYDTINGKIKEEQVFDSDRNSITKNKPDISITYEYDKKGNLIKNRTISNVENMEIVYTNDKKGRILEELDIINNEKFTYKYDKRGNCIEENKYRDDEHITKTLSTYDSYGNKFEHNIEYFETNTNVNTLTKFDKHNNPISKEKTIDGIFENKYIFTYEYDDETNWIKQSLEYTKKNGDYSAIIIERQIEYFDPSYEELEDTVLQSFDNNMTFIKGGTFLMGSNSGKSNERPQHEVTLSDFYMSRYEVTQQQWEYVMGYNPSGFKGCKDCPVEEVSWADAQQFIIRLNKLTGKKYRLPTEAEWEYAAKGGSISRNYKYAGSNTLGYTTWHSSLWKGGGNSGNRTHPVGQKLPNELGLYDMFGNVTEVCNDSYEKYTHEPKVDPEGAETGHTKIWRGASWYNAHDAFRYTNRGTGWYTDKSDISGLRLCTTNLYN